MWRSSWEVGEKPVDTRDQFNQFVTLSHLAYHSNEHVRSKEQFYQSNFLDHGLNLYNIPEGFFPL